MLPTGRLRRAPWVFETQLDNDGLCLTNEEEAISIESGLERLLDDNALIKAKSLDVDSASQISDSSVIQYHGARKSSSFQSCIKSITSELGILMPELDGLQISGNAIYLKGSHMGWHCNHSRSDGRVYCSWNQSGNSNYFRYQHPLTGEIITDWEDPDWNIKSFIIPQTPSRFWHCVATSSVRLSLGFCYNLSEKS